MNPFWLVPIGWIAVGYYMVIEEMGTENWNDKFYLLNLRQSLWLMAKVAFFGPFTRSKVLDKL